eukprot:11199755-Lingulodinium_polyedra.AAC.1
MRAVRSLLQPGRRVAIDGALEAVLASGLARNLASRALENWSAIGAWRPRGEILEIANWARDQEIEQ